MSVISGNGDGLNWNSGTRGLTLANGKIYFGGTDGNLSSITFGATAPVPGTETLVSPVTATNWASGGLFVFSAAAPDTTPPSVPGLPTGQSPIPGSIVISWAGSTDASTPITYRIFRDGGSTAIGSTTGTSFTDGGLTPGTTHTYRVNATDAVGNVSQLSAASSSITVSTTSSAIFADDFTGGFANWSGVTNLTIDTSIGGVAAPSARGQVTSQAGFAFKDLSVSLDHVCMSARVNIGSVGSPTVALFRLRTVANGPVARAYVTSAGDLLLRADVSGAQRSSGVALGSGWHTIELLRDGRIRRFMESVSRRRCHRGRLGREHRDRERRPGGDRRYGGDDLERELRRRRGGSDAGLSGYPRDRMGVRQDQRACVTRTCQTR